MVLISRAACLLSELQPGEPMQVIDRETITAKGKSNGTRVLKDMVQCTATGRIAKERALLEVQRKYPETNLSSKEMTAALLDHRLCNDEGPIHFRSSC